MIKFKLKGDLIIPEGTVFEISPEETLRFPRTGFLMTIGMQTPSSRIWVEIAYGDMTEKEKQEYFEKVE
ncbi:MAG: hypothetical protein ACW97W_17505 [Candidatus Hodarchaeales archaeon]|jgi:hypothetical protein